MSGKDKIIDLKKGIRREVVKFIAGCILFALMAACTIISAVLLILNPGLDFPHGIWILAVGGVVLLWEMGRAFWVSVIGNEKYIIFGKMEYIRISNNDASFSVTMVHRFR